MGTLGAGGSPRGHMGALDALAPPPRTPTQRAQELDPDLGGSSGFIQTRVKATEEGEERGPGFPQAGVLKQGLSPTCWPSFFLGPQDSLALPQGTPGPTG